MIEYRIDETGKRMNNLKLALAALIIAVALSALGAAYALGYGWAKG